MSIFKLNNKSKIDQEELINSVQGTFKSSNSQIINPNEYIIFEKGDNISNINFDNNTSSIKILHSGLYMFNINCHFNESCQVVLYINNKPELSTLTTTESNSQIIIINQLIQLSNGDVLSFGNYMGYTPITTFVSHISIKEASNIQLNIWKIL